jgi:hypothetical protein
MLDMTPKRLVFASVIYHGRTSELNALLFVESIREFGGDLSQAPIWCYVSENDVQISSKVKDRVLALDVLLLPFKESQRFPFVGHAQAASLAESRAEGEADILVWSATNTVFLQEPGEFLLQDGKSLGYRPVHHALIGSRFNEPLDPFWSEIYEQCNVPEIRIFPMKTHVEETEIRPYFNAGCLATRPEEGLFRRYYESFLGIYQKSEFKEFYKKDERYMIFIHQAVLSGIILSELENRKLVQLSPSYNYPMHLYDEDTTKDQPSSIENVITFRHEGFHADPDWEKKIPAGNQLKNWIKTKLESV